MAWFKVDDHFWSHPKTGDLSDGATALWLRAGSWSAGHLTDGYVPTSKLRLFRARRRSIEELVDAGLWSGVEGGYLFHDWSDYQPSREAVTARRDATKNRVDAWRKRQGNDVTEPDGDENGTPDVTPPPTRPDPARPGPSSKEEVRGAAKRGSRIPDSFAVDDLMRQWAKTKAPAVEVDRETENFRDYWRAKAGRDAVKVDWKATWQTWMRRAQGYAERDGWKPDERAGLRDVTAEAQAEQQRAWLEAEGLTAAEYQRMQAAGVTGDEYRAHRHDDEWRARFREAAHG